MEFCLGNGFELLSVSTIFALLSRIAVFFARGNCLCIWHKHYRNQCDDCFATYCWQHLSHLNSSSSFVDVFFFFVFRSILRFVLCGSKDSLYMEFCPPIFFVSFTSKSIYFRYEDCFIQDHR